MAQEMDRLEIVIEAQAKQAASELDHLYQSLEKVSGSLSRISAKNALSGLASAAKSAASGVASGAKQIASHFSLIGSSSSKIRTATSSLKGLLGAVIGFYGIRSLINLGKDAMELSSDLTEVQNVVENAFGPAGTEAVENFTETSIQKFGLAELAAKQISSRFQAMGKSMGITGQMIAEANEHVGKSMDDMYDSSTNDLSAMSLNITKLAADMASFYNVDQEAAAQALSTIWTGQTRPLRQYGLDITQATLAEWAMKHGIDADIQSMTQAQKTMLRYQYVMSQTQMVQGDFNRTAFTWANQTRILRQQFEMLGKTIGDVLINIFRPLITWLNQAMAKIISFAETVANALGKIFGWTIIHTPAATTANDDFVDSLGDIGDAGKDAADGTGKATKALKEYENTVLGFDELNKLNPIPTDTSSPSGGSGSGSPSSSGSTASAAGADFQLVRTDNLIEKYKSDINNLYDLGAYIRDTLSDALGKIEWDKVYEKARDFGTGLARFLNGLVDDPKLFKALGTTIAGSINAALNAKDAFLDEFHFSKLGASLGAGLMSFFETWDAGLQAKTFYKTVNGIVDTIWAALNEIGTVGFSFIGTKISSLIRDALAGIEWETKVFPTAKEFGKDLASFLEGLIDEDTFSEVASAVANSLSTALMTLSSFGATMTENGTWKKFGVSVGASLKRFFLYDMKWDLAASTFTKLASGIVTSAGAAIDTFAEGNGFYVLGRKISKAIRNIPWAELLRAAGDVIWKGLNAAIDFGKGLFSGTPFEEALTKLQTKLNDIAGRIHFDEISKGVGDIVKALAPAVSGFAKGILEVFGGLGGLGAEILNAIGKMFEKIAGALNSLPPGVVEKLGEDFGKLVGYILAIKGADAVIGILGGILTKVLGLGGAATGAAIGVGGLGTAAGAASTGGIAKFVAALGTSEAGLIGAVIIAGQKVAELFDVMRGGNGKLTEEGGAFDSFIESLKSVSALAETDSQELYLLKEAYENGEISAEEFFTTVSEKLDESGVSAGEATTAITGLKTEMNLTDQQAGFLSKSIEGLGSTSTAAASTINLAGIDSKQAFSNIEQAIKDTTKASGNMSDIWNNVLLQTFRDTYRETGSVEEAYSNMRTLMSDMGIGAETLNSKILEYIPDAFNTLMTGASNSATNVGDLHKEIRDLSSGSESNATTLKDKLSGALANIAEKAGLADEESGTLKSSIWTFAGGIAAQALLMAVMGSTFGTVGKKAENAQEPVTGLKGTIGDLVDSIPGFKETLDSDSYDLGSAIPQGMEKGLTENESLVTTAGDTLVTDFINSVKNPLGINSPSKTMHGFGMNIDEGLANGINDFKGLVTAAITGVLSDMKSKISAELTNFKNHGAALTQMFKSGLTSISLSDVPRTLFNTMGFGGFNTDMRNAGASAASAFASGMRSVYLPMPHLNFDYWVRNNGVGYNYGYNTSISWYALGGFPNTGDLFMANEKGPEMVGKMGNRNVVANNAQITAGIKAAVIDGMMEVAMAGAFGGRSGSDGTPMTLNATIRMPDGEVLARVVEKAQARRDSRYNTVAQY